MVEFFRPEWARRFPEKASKSLLLTAGLSGAMGLTDILLATKAFREYGLVLFVVLPCFVGIGAPLLHGMGAPRSFLQCFGAAVLSMFAMFCGMLVFGIEGIGCMIMGAPIWIGIAAVGTCVAYPLHRALWKQHIQSRGFPIAGLLLMVVIPMLLGAERVANWTTPVFTLTSAVEIDAPPEVVWRHLIAFPEMPRPRQWVFTLGIAYPVRAEMSGRGIGATRYCVFCTGKAEERVTEWEENRRLEFDVVSTPPSMQEWSPYPHIQPAHLEGYMVSKRASFELTALPNGRTRLVGTSWYENRMFPVAYWKWWSDRAVKAVHEAVFAHVKQLSEQAAGPGKGVIGVRK